jgi:hypothetical protein
MMTIGDDPTTRRPDPTRVALVAVWRGGRQYKNECGFEVLVLRYSQKKAMSAFAYFLKVKRVDYDACSLEWFEKSNPQSRSLQKHVRLSSVASVGFAGGCDERFLSGWHRVETRQVALLYA